MRRPLLRFTLLAMLGGCTSFAPRTGSPAAVAPHEFPRTVRLVRTDSSRITLFQAQIEADTIRGEVANGLAMKVATKDVARWEARQFDAGRSTGVAVMTAMIGKLLWEVLKPAPVVFTPGGVAVQAP